MSEKRQSRRVAHASFWFIDAEGRNRVALRGDTVELDADDLKRGEKFDAFEVVAPEPEGEPEGEGDQPDPEGDEGDDDRAAKIKDVLAEVGDDKTKAAEALEQEKARGESARSTLLAKLQAVIDAN